MKSALTLLMQKIQNTIFWTIIASETTHVFCCVLPTIVSIMSLLSGMGLIATMPGWLNALHEMMHNWEAPVIIFSGVLLVAGWALYAISRRIDCLTDADCHHEPCAPKKKNASRILLIATVLFIANSTVYFVFHRAMGDSALPTASSHSESHQGHVHHD
jgi:hypothetical protein